MSRDDAFKRPNATWCWQIQAYVDSEYLSIKITHPIDIAEPAAKEQAVAHEIQGSTSIECSWHAQWLGDSRWASFLNPSSSRYKGRGYRRRGQ